MIVLSCAQFSNWIGTKVRPCMMGRNVAVTGVIASRHSYYLPLFSVHRTNVDIQWEMCAKNDAIRYHSGKEVRETLITPYCFWTITA